jgi:hydrogenase/urease accessory protein HupE
MIYHRRGVPIYRVLLAMLLALQLFRPQEASAHESRPAYLEINQIAVDHYDLIWRTPLLSRMRLPVVLKLPDGVRDVRQSIVQEFSDSLLERRKIEVAGGLSGKRIDFVGLQATITDVLVRVRMLDGTYSTTLVSPSRPWIDVATSRGLLEVAGAYVKHGIEHILFGYDHLLFVLALILIVRSGRVLLLTVTAFTVAHSITLSLAALAVVRVPGPPVEAAIALSILLLAREIIRSDRGQMSLTAKWPWLVAFSFGLLHGFGFASALAEIGLPQRDIPLALFSFNVGVEIGQLIFIAIVLSALACARLVKFPPIFERYASAGATYAIGIVAAFWFIERLSGFGA